MELSSAVRSRVDQLRARIRSLGLRETLLIERDVLRRLLKSTLAATLAWVAAELIHSPRPALASLGAILVVQITVRASLARSIQLTVAVGLGLGAAVALGHVVGLHWWSVALVVLASLITGELLRLGPLSGQVAISALLALSLGSGYGIERVIDTAIGALIGVAVNALIAPPSYVSEASRTLRALGEDLGGLLEDIGKGLSTDLDDETIRRWLTRARDLATDSRAAIGTVKQGEESLQFNPLGRSELNQLGRLGEARRALAHAINQTRGIVRSLLDVPRPITDPAIADGLAALGPLFAEAGRAVAAFGRLQEDPTSQVDREVLQQTAREAPAISEHLAHVLAPLTSSSDEPAGLLLASVLVDLERLLREVDINDGAHREAVAWSPAGDSEDPAQSGD